MASAAMPSVRNMVMAISARVTPRSFRTSLPSIVAPRRPGVAASSTEARYLMSTNRLTSVPGGLPVGLLPPTKPRNRPVTGSLQLPFPEHVRFSTKTFARLLSWIVLQLGHPPYWDGLYNPTMITRPLAPSQSDPVLDPTTLLVASSQ